MKDFKKYYLIQASPEEVYLALTNPLTISLWTGAEAIMSTEPGSEFWYFGDQSEESIVTFILHPDKNGTSVELRHTNIPDSDIDDMIDGWNLNYFGALQDFYDE
jgi:uncharacterized protein YndB with AHSA1/START domain